MAGSKTDYLEAEVLKWETGQANALGAAPTPYLALYSTAPTDAAGGTEITTNGQTRISSAGKWAAPSGGAVSTNADVLFPTVTGGSITVVGVACFDAASAGNMLWYYDVTSKTIVVGDQAKITAGTITITEA